MPLYTKKPVTIEASQFHGLGDHSSVVEDVQHGFVVEGRQGAVRVDPGDWILPELNGAGFYPCKPDVFAATYEPVLAVDGSALSFGDAISALKAGERICRAGWNGKGMWLALTQGTPDLPAEKFWNPHNRAFAEQNGGTANVQPTITMKTAQGDIQMGWHPSIPDVLAEDWMVLLADAA